MSATDIVAGILAAIAEALTTPNTTPPTDDGAPAQFAEWDQSDFSGSQDRHFAVELLGLDEHGSTGLDTSTTVHLDAYILAQVRMRFINEGRSTRLFHGYVGRDIRTVQDRVQRHLRNQDGTTPAGVAECRTEGMATVIPGEDPSHVFALIPFRIEYADLAKTS